MPSKGWSDEARKAALEARKRKHPIKIAPKRLTKTAKQKELDRYSDEIYAMDKKNLAHVENTKYRSRHMIQQILEDDVEGDSIFKKNKRFSYAQSKTGRIVGAGFLSVGRFDTIAYVNQLGSIQKGAGSLVLADLEKQAKAAGMTRIELTPASGSLSFYLKQGYRDSGSGVGRMIKEI